jgi:hypothetical protein
MRQTRWVCRGGVEAVLWDDLPNAVKAVPLSELEEAIAKAVSEKIGREVSCSFSEINFVPERWGTSVNGKITLSAPFGFTGSDAPAKEPSADPT